MNALRIGTRRGWLEFVHLIKDRREFVTSVIGTVGIFAFLVLWIGDSPIEGTSVTSGTFMMPGFLAFVIFTQGMTVLPMTVISDRDDGTLLRLRALPGGLPVYVIGRAVTVLCQIALQCALVMATGVAMGVSVLPSSAAAWLTVAWVLVLGTLAVVPLGAVLGSVLSNPKTAGAVLGFTAMPLMIISGVMLPTSMMPEPVQWIAQAFPLYWQGLGLRSAFLPDTMLAAEIGASWRPGLTAAVLGVWALAGLLLAPLMLRRTTRRESGSRLVERRLAAQV